MKTIKSFVTEMVVRQETQPHLIYKVHLNMYNTILVRESGY